MTQPVARIKNLTKQIGNNEVVKHLNFDIHQGEIVGFLGPNGAGKTTTMRMMVGHMAISEGDVEIDGYSVKKNKEQALKHVGGIIETPELYKFLSGYDNLVHFGRMTGPVDKQRIEEVTELVGLTGVIKHKVKTYSLGMRQRLGIAQALLNHPQLLILDEPTNGLDPSGIKEIRDYLRKLSEEAGIAVFVSSHLLSEIELLCDRIIIIQKGEITDEETVNSKNDDEAIVTLEVKATPLDAAWEILHNFDKDVEQKEDVFVLKLPYNTLPVLHHELVKQELNVYTLSVIKQTLEERFLQKTNVKGEA